MLGTLLIDKNTQQVLSAPSQYNPSNEVKTFTAQVREDYHIGYENQHRPYREFNDRSLLQIMDADQKSFNIYTEPASADPKEAWRYFGVRPITRNKIISIAAHLTATVLYPSVFAQNTNDEQDQEVAEVMRDLIEYNIKNSDYEETFLFGVISLCVNPAVILAAEYNEVMQDIRTRSENGEITTKQAIDEVLSGFQTNIVPIDELLISNMYEYEIQKQRFLIRRRLIDYADARALYGNHENFLYVRPGIKVFFNASDEMFYEQTDTEKVTMIEEVTYYNRAEDLEVVFLNGIYMGEPEIRDNIMKHRRVALATDGMPVSVPLYKFAKSGGEPIDEKRFFYYKSYASKLGNDQTLVDRMWRMVVDGTFLDVMKPIITSGAGKIDTGVIFPGAVTDIGKDAKVFPLSGMSNLNSGYNAIASIEQTMSESSQSDTRGGQITPGGVTAYEISKAEQNAKIQLGLIGKMITFLVRDFGELMIDCIVQHQTVAQAMDTQSPTVRLKFQKFLLSDQNVAGKNVTKEIRFTEEMLGLELTEDEKKGKQYDLLDEGGGDNIDRIITLVNPYLFAQFRFKCFVDAENLTPKNEILERAYALEGYDRLIASPYVDQLAVTRDFLVKPIAKGETDRYMKNPAEIQQEQMVAQQAGNPEQMPNLTNQNSKLKTEMGLIK